MPVGTGAVSKPVPNAQHKPRTHSQAEDKEMSCAGFLPDPTYQAEDNQGRVEDEEKGV